MRKPLVLVSDHTKIYQQNRLEPLNDFAPRRDYIEIAQKLGADLLGYDLSNAAWYRWARQLEAALKLDFIESFSAASQSSGYNIVLSASEKVAIPLAATLHLMKREIPHIVIGHKLSSTFKSRLFSIWPLHQKFSQVVCLCRSQFDYTVNKLGFAESKVNFVYDKVDHRFFRPLKVDTDDYILAVGREQRDYQTLLQAVLGTGLKLFVVASSPWSTYQIGMEPSEEVTVLRNITYQELRTLYAKARLIVVPLFDVDYAAGVNSLLEAMAMGKPSIVSRTSGIRDYVTDDETGVYVSPGNVDELRDTILSLWEKPRELDRLGENARQVVEEGMNLDTYIDRIVQIVHKTMTGYKI